MQNRPENCRATRNFLQVYFLLQLHYANEVKPNWHNEIQHLVVCCLPSKDACRICSFVALYPDFCITAVNLKLSITEIYANRQRLSALATFGDSDIFS